MLPCYAIILRLGTLITNQRSMSSFSPPHQAGRVGPGPRWPPTWVRVGRGGEGLDASPETAGERSGRSARPVDRVAARFWHGIVACWGFLTADGARGHHPFPGPCRHTASFIAVAFLLVYWLARPRPGVQAGPDGHPLVDADQRAELSRRRGRSGACLRRRFDRSGGRRIHPLPAVGPGEGDDSRLRLPEVSKPGPRGPKSPGRPRSEPLVTGSLPDGEEARLRPAVVRMLRLRPSVAIVSPR